MMQKLLVLSSLLALTSLTQAQRITTIQLDGVQYFVSRMNPYSPELNYFLAYQYCRSLGLQLASFETKEKADSITSYLGNAGYNKYDFWTSGNKLGTDMYLWMSTGLPFNATFNYIKRPQEGADSQLTVDVPTGSTSPQRTARDSGSSGDMNSCIALKAPDFEWGSEDCMVVKDFICEQTRCYYYNYGSIPVSSAQGRPIYSTTMRAFTPPNAAFTPTLSPSSATTTTIYKTPAGTSPPPPPPPKGASANSATTFAPSVAVSMMASPNTQPPPTPPAAAADLASLVAPPKLAPAHKFIPQAAVGLKELLDKLRTASASASVDPTANAVYLPEGNSQPVMVASPPIAQQAARARLNDDVFAAPMVVVSALPSPAASTTKAPSSTAAPLIALGDNSGGEVGDIDMETATNGPYSAMLGPAPAPMHDDPGVYAAALKIDPAAQDSAEATAHPEMVTIVYRP